jgi:hypothetical protein
MEILEVPYVDGEEEKKEMSDLTGEGMAKGGQGYTL